MDWHSHVETGTANVLIKTQGTTYFPLRGSHGVGDENASWLLGLGELTDEKMQIFNESKNWVII